MTKIKMCGLTTEADILAANELRPEYIGFVFWPKSKRYISPERAAVLRQLLDDSILAAGVFVDECPETVAELLNQNVIDLAQLHGHEDNAYIRRLRDLIMRHDDRTVIEARQKANPSSSVHTILQAFRLNTQEDVEKALLSTADMILLDSGAGTGNVFDWNLIRGIDRPYFLAGGLHPDNVTEAIQSLHPYAVDVSSGIETEGKKDRQKMAAFAAAVRKEDHL